MTTFNGEKPIDDIELEMLSLNGDIADGARVDMGSDGGTAEDGSTTNVLYEYVVPGEKRFLWTRSNMVALDAAPRPSRFVGQTKLTNGCLFQVCDPTGTVVVKNITRRNPIKQNADWVLLAGTDETSEIVTNEGQVAVRWTMEKTGARMWVPPRYRIRFVVRDDLAGVESLRIMVQGTLYTSSD